MSPLINVHCQRNKQIFHLCGRYYLEATFAVAEVRSEKHNLHLYCCSEGASLWSALNMQPTGLIPAASKRGEPRLVSDAGVISGGITSFPVSGVYSNSKRCVSVFIIPTFPLWIHPQFFCEREDRKRCTVALSRSSEKLCHEWHPQSDILHDYAARLTVNNHFFFDRVCHEWERLSHSYGFHQGEMWSLVIVRVTKVVCYSIMKTSSHLSTIYIYI